MPPGGSVTDGPDRDVDMQDADLIFSDVNFAIVPSPGLGATEEAEVREVLIIAYPRY